MDRTDLATWSSAEVARLLTLVESEKRYIQEMLLLAPAAMAVVGPDQTIHSVNRAFRRLVPWKYEPGSALRLPDLLPGPELSAALEAALTARETQTVRVSAPGPNRPLSATLIPLPPRFALESENALLVLEKEAAGDPAAAAMLDEAGAVIWDQHLATRRIRFANNGARRLAPLLEQPQNWLQRVHPDDQGRVEAVYASVAAWGNEAEVDYRVVLPSGIAWLCDAVRPGGPERPVAVLRILTTEITARRGAQRVAMQRQRMEAAQSLAQHVAHAANNLWTIAAGYSEILASRLGTGDAEAPQLLAEIEQAAARGASAAEQLLQFGRPAAVQWQTADLHELLQEANLAVHWKLSGESYYVRVDRLRFRKAMAALCEGLRPLLGTSGGLGGETGRRLIGSDYGWGPCPGEYIFVRFGPLSGVSGQRLERWADPFFAEDERAVPIGLAPVYTELLQMEIHAAMERNGSGDAWLLMLLPRAPAPPPPPAPAEPVALAVASGAAGPQPARGTIVVADGEESIRLLIGKHLTRKGFRVLSGGSRSAAASVAAAEAGPIDLVITDLRLPDGTGLDLVQQLRVRHPHLRAVYLSGCGGLEQLPERAAGEEDGFLQKPFSLDGLEGSVHTVLKKA